MKLEKMIKDIVFITSKFYLEEDKSIYTLLEETGYFEHNNQVNESNIYNCLKLYPECISQWITWSENKRSSSGWYFTKESDIEYTVGYLSSSQVLDSKKYSNKIKACAIFIIHEIEEIRLS